MVQWKARMRKVPRNMDLLSFFLGGILSNGIYTMIFSLDTIDFPYSI